jgi:malonyl-CoA/methylmalonyl-CoA synthetase
MSENLFAIFRSRLPADPSKVFLERSDGSTLTYADLISFSGRLANALIRVGVKPGDRVAAQVEKSPEALLLYLAALRAGAVYLPLNSAYTSSELRYFLGDAEPTVFVCRPEVAAEMNALATEVGVPRVETLGPNGEGSLIERPVRKRRSSRMSRGHETTSRPSSTRPARQAVPKVRC